MKKSKEYYLMYNGGCRQVMLDDKGNMDEYPHNFKLAEKCKQPGKHPHKRINFHSGNIVSRKTNK